MPTTDPAQPAFERFEAARLKYIAMSEHAYAVCAEVEAELTPAPPCNCTSRAKEAEHSWWQAQRRRRVERQLGTDEDEYCRGSRDQMETAFKTLTAIEPTTVAGVLSKMRAWWNEYQDPGADLPGPEANASEAEVFLIDLYRDLERLDGEARS